METLKRRGRPKKVVTDTSSSKIFTISLAIGDLKYEGQGATPLEALLALPKPQKMVFKGVVRFSNGIKTRALVYTPFQIKRLFYPIAQKVVAKQLSIGMV